MAKTDTGECIQMTAVADEHAEQIDVDRIEWATAGGTIGDECIITDSGGEPIAHFIAATANHSEQRKIGRKYSGIKLSTFDSGILYIHLSGK